MKFNSILAVILATVVLAACSEGEKSSVVTYKDVKVEFDSTGQVISSDTSLIEIPVDYVSKGVDSAIVENQIMLIHLIYTLEDGKEMFNTTSEGKPMPFMYQPSAWDQGGQFFAVLKSLSKGDSVNFEIDAEDFYLKTFRAPAVPDTVPSPSKLKFTIGVEEVTDREGYQAYMEAAAEKRAEKIFAEEKETIANYAKENGLEVQYTESGLAYVITEQGEGENAKEGDSIEAHYSGFLLDGNKFDSSVDRGQPFSFTVGVGMVIKGWDEGFTLLNPGSKATLLIPSSLAYAERGAPGAIPPNSVLRFDVELISIKAPEVEVQ